MKYKVNDKVQLIKDASKVRFRIGEITFYISPQKNHRLIENAYRIKFSCGNSLEIYESEMDNYFIPLSKTKLKIKIQELQGDTSKVKIISFSSLKSNELPKEYLSSFFVCLSSISEKLAIKSKNFSIILQVGDIIKKSDFDKICEICEESANKLRKINKNKLNFTEFTF